MNINDAFPSQYLRASDLKGAQPIVTIERVEMESVGRTKDRKPVVYFQGKDKGIVLNRTNCNKIVEIAGSAVTEEWHGVQIQLYATEVEFQGDTVEAIRVRAPVRRATPKPAPKPAHSSDEFADVDAEEVPF